MRTHEWRDRTDEGEVRLVRGINHGGHWRIEARLKSELSFQELDPPPLEDLEALLEIVENKYRRGCAPHEHIEQIVSLVEQAELIE